MQSLSRTVAVVILLLSGVAGADVVHLSDGSTREGTVKRVAGAYELIRADGTVEQIPAGQVKSIELRRTGAPAPGATTAPVSADPSLTPTDASTLASLRRSLENVTDPKQAVDRLEAFIERNKQSPVAAVAGADLDVWKDRLDRGLVRAGGKWVTPAEHDVLLAHSVGAADEARQLIKAGRLRDAETLLGKLLQDDPRNATALYLRGVVTYRTDRIPLARQNFDAVAALVSDHAPTSNNLAVVMGRQNQVPAALNAYDQAMTASPLNQAILDNVAEALHSLPENLHNNAITRRVSRKFTEQDTLLQQKLAADGWYRWGATWVTQAQLDQLNIVEREIVAKLDKLATDFDVVQNRIRQIELDIESNNRTIRQLEAAQWGRDLSGNPVRFALPDVYYDLAADNKRLAATRAVEVRKLDDLRLTATRIKQQGPQPKFTGVQRIIGEEGAPILVGPTTRP